MPTKSPDAVEPQFTEAQADGWICHLAWETKTIVRTSCARSFSAELLAAFGGSKKDDPLRQAMDGALLAQVHAENLLVLRAAQAAGRTHFRSLGDASPEPDFASRTLKLGGLYEVLTAADMVGKTYEPGTEPLSIGKALEIMIRDGESKDVEIR